MIYVLKIIKKIIHPGPTVSPSPFFPSFPQIKGRFMRTKTLIIEDPVFVDDAEHVFGATLARWEELGAGGVAAAALENNIAENRLQHTARKVLLEKSPESLLKALDSVLTLYEDVKQLESNIADGTEKEVYAKSLQCTQQIAFQICHGYLTAVGGSVGGGGDTTSFSNNSSSPSSQAIASLASVLAHHGTASEWTVGFLQPQPQDLVPVLLALAEERRKKLGNIFFSPVAVLRILDQLDVSSDTINSQLYTNLNAHLLPRTLVDLVPLGHQLSSLPEGGSGSGSGDSTSDSAAAVEICTTVQKVLLQLTQRSSEHTSTAVSAAIAESLLELLLAASKGISTTAATLRHQQADNISIVADWIFSYQPQYPVHQKLILQIVSSIPWEWLSARCPSKLRLRWLLASVAVAKALHKGDSIRAGTEAGAAVHALSEVLSSKLGWKLAMGSFQEGEDVEQGRMLCLLEAPISEPPAVLLVWRQVQATVALALCTHWMQTNNRSENNRGSESVKEDVATLLGGAHVPDALTQMAQSRHSTAAVSIISHVVNSTADVPEFLTALYPTLSLTLSAALSFGDTGAVIANTAVLEKFVNEAVLSCNNNTKEDAFASLAAWLGLFVGILAQRDGLSDLSASPVVLMLVAKLCKAAYSLGFDKRKLGWLLLHLANALRDQPVSQTQQLIAQLLSGAGGDGGEGGGSRDILAWLRVLGAWIANASSLISKMPQQHGVESWSIKDAETIIEREMNKVMVENEASSFSSTPDQSEAAANEVFLLQDAIATIQSTSTIPALVLYYELFYHISNNYGTLSPLIDRQELSSSITFLSQQISPRSPELAGVFTSLLKIFENESEVTAVEPGLLPFVGDFSAVEKVISVLAPRWLEEDWKTSPVDSLATDFAASVSLVEAAGDVPSPSLQKPPPPPSSTDSSDFLVHQQEQQATALAAAQEELRYWVRQGEKAAARPEGEEPSPDHGKEGDIPEPLASAQRHLWELEQRQREELSHIHAALRQKVCQQYNPIDEQFLQEASEAFSDGDRIPRAMLFRDSQHSAQCQELRNQAFQVALRVTSAKELTLAAKELFTFEYLLLEAVEKEEAKQERAGIRSKLLAVMAHSLVDGSTPVTAIPYMVGLFERAVSSGDIVLDTDAKLRLIPRIAASLGSGGTGAGGVGGIISTGGGPVQKLLREKQGMRLLNACLDPDALLNAGKLREFMTALQLIVRLSVTHSGGGGGSDFNSQQPSVMLSSFDAQRFAVLVAEKPGAVRLGGAGSTSSAAAVGGSGGSSWSGSGSASGSTSSPSAAKGKSKEVGIEEVLNLAAECLAYPSSAPTGSALLEGILNLHPASLYTACLGVVLNAPPTGRRDIMLTMLGQVPMDMLDPPVLAEALSLLIISLNSGAIDPPDLPYGLLGTLVKAAPVLESIRTTMEAFKASGSSGTSVKLESFSMKKAAWTVTTTAAATSTLQPVSSSYKPLGILAEDVLQGVMNAVLRLVRNNRSNGGGEGALATSASSGGGSTNVHNFNGSDLVQPVFGIIFELAGVCSLEWLWLFYQTHLCSFIADVDKVATSSGTASCAAAFQQYWASLPWN
jgi:hypothetical protein